MNRSLVSRLTQRCLVVGLNLAPLGLAVAAHAASTNQWGDFVGALAPGSLGQRWAWWAWPTAQLSGSIAVLGGAVVAERLGAAHRLAVGAAAAGLVVATALTVWPEFERLGIGQPGAAWLKRLAGFDARVAFAGAIGILSFAGLVRFLRGARGLTDATGAQFIERATTDNFGHADWMEMGEARQLFSGSRSPIGGIVIGEAYRVDRDRVARVPFDPRARETWGQGGAAPLLTYDFSFGATHGLAFAGSGGFKTVSVCVGALLSYRGPTVVLDPSTELAPMLLKARISMGHRVIAIDPAKPADTGFNILDWLDPASATADADVRSVVDWICGERRPATAKDVSGAGRFFEGRGKAMVESLLSDLVFDTRVPADERTLKRLAARLALPEKDMRVELDRIHKSSASSRARHLAGQLKQLVKETFSGVYGNMSEQTEWLANPRFAALVSGSAFHTRELAEGKLDLFLNIPMKVLETTPALARCIVGALLNAVYEVDGKLKSRVLFLLDEVARLGFMASLTRARDAGRKYGITLVMLYQSEGQLVEQWGEDGRSAWFESVTWRSYSAVADVGQAKVLSEACGEHGVVSTSVADSKGVSRRQPLQLGTKSTSESMTRSEQRRRLITADEILQDMRTDEQIVFVRGRRPLRCGRAIYFRRPEMLAQVEANGFAHTGHN